MKLNVELLFDWESVAACKVVNFRISITHIPNLRTNLQSLHNPLVLRCQVQGQLVVSFARKGVINSTTAGEETAFAVVLLHLNEAQSFIHIK